MKSLFHLFLVSGPYLLVAENLLSSTGENISSAKAPILKEVTVTDPAVNQMRKIVPPASLAQRTVYARDFGFSSSASAAKNTVAIQQISAMINSSDGGVTLIIDKGVYTVGKENFAGKSKKGFAYLGEHMFVFENCTKPIIVEGNGATIKLANKLHFGSFHPVTGAAYNAPPGGFYNYDYVSYPRNIIDAKKNKSVTIRNLTVDGNVQNLVIGGYWGDMGLQLHADAFFFHDNDEVMVENVTGRYSGRDGIHIGNTTSSAKSPIKKITIKNSTFDGNVRQGFSWIGGNHLSVVNSKFINTGRTVNLAKKTAIASAPSAGVDMEAELGLIRNGVFQDCYIYNNVGAGLLSVGDVADIKVIGGKTIGTTSWSLYGAGPRMLFIGHTVIGSGVNLFYSLDTTNPNLTRFINCTLTLDTTLSPNGQVYGNYILDLGGGGSPVFYNCTLDASRRSGVYGGNCVFENCTFKQSAFTQKGYSGYSFMVGGTFKGINRMIYPGGIPDNPNRKTSKFYGPFYINGIDVSGLSGK